MICQECHQRPAALHFKKTLNGKVNEVYLCEQCAQEKGEHLFSGHPAFSLNNLLGGLFNPEQLMATKPSYHEEETRCENCQMTFQQFLQVGKLGCAHCYQTFDSKLMPILKRLHGGNTVHQGKVPTRLGGNLHLQRQLKKLREQLQKAISDEQFEKAAEIRDEIRSLEPQLADEGGGSNVS